MTKTAPPVDLVEVGPYAELKKEVRKRFSRGSNKPNRGGEVVVVAGAAGFVGSRVSAALCDVGVRVIGLDNFNTGTEKDIRDLGERDNFELIEVDVLGGLPKSLFAEKITHIVDAVNVTPHVGRTQFSLTELLDDSLGLKNLLELANRVKAKFVYTSSAGVYEGLASHESLKYYYDGQELTTYFSFVEGKRYGEALCREYVEKYGLDVRVARFSEIYGQGMDLQGSSLLTRVIRLGTAGKDLVLDEEGSAEHQLIYIDDVVYGLVKLIFAEDDVAQAAIFYFVNPERVSTLSIAYTMRAIAQAKSIARELKVEFIPQHHKIKLPGRLVGDISRTEKVLMWSPKVDLTDGLERTVTWLMESNQSGEVDVNMVEVGGQVVDSVVESPSVDKLAKKPSPKGGWLSLKNRVEPTLIKGLQRRGGALIVPLKRVGLFEWVLVGVILFFVLLSPLLLTSGFAYLGWRSTITGQFNRARSDFSYATMAWKYYRIPAQVLGWGEMHLAIEQTLSTAGYGVATLASFDTAIQPLAVLASPLAESWQGDASAVIAIDEEKLTQRMSLVSTKFKEVENDFGVFSQKLKNIQLSALPGRYGERLRPYVDLAESMASAIETMPELVGRLDYFLGYDAPRRYLVLLQNNAEVRPTGGFIGSYIVFNIDRGRIGQFKVDNIYNPDGLLADKSELPVPPPMAKHLQLNSVGIRDANWWSDFPTSLSAVQQLYDQATGEQIDGVVAINLHTVQQILANTGPIELPEYQETVTADNIFDLAESHAEVGFEPGSSQKQDFLGVLTEELLARLFTDPSGVVAPALVRGILFDIAGRDLVFYSTEPTVQAVFEKMGWAGKLQGLGDAVDYIRVVDANLGGNKANQWVNRSTEYQVSVDRDGYLTGRLSVNWQHTGQNTTWPNGDYLNYVRVYLPPGITSISVDPALEDQENYLENGRMVVAGSIVVPIDSSRTVRIRYRLPDEFRLGQTSSYQLIWDNQPGIIAEPIVFSLDLPSFLSSKDNLRLIRQLDWPMYVSTQIDGTETIAKAPIVEP